MKIVVMGTGGVGGYFGARLAASGEDVRFVARGAHLEAIKRDGLRITSKLGDLTIRPEKVSASAAEVGPADFVMIAVKLWGTQEAIEAVRHRADVSGLEPGEQDIINFVRQLLRTNKVDQSLFDSLFIQPRQLREHFAIQRSGMAAHAALRTSRE